MTKFFRTAGKYGLAACVAVAAVLGQPVRAVEDTLSSQAVEGAIAKALLNEIFSGYLAAIQRLDPETATGIGVHATDNKLTNRTADDEALYLAMTKDTLQQLQKVDREMMSPKDRIDLELFENKLMMDAYNLENQEPIKKSPQYYLQALDSVYDLLINESAPYSQRAKNALQRLEQFPYVLIQAEKNLYHPPKLWVLYTMNQCDYALDTFPQLVPLFKRYMMLDPIVRARVETAVDRAREAIRQYKEYLRNDMLLQADGDFRAGNEMYGFYLEKWHGFKVAPKAVEKRMQSIYNESRGEFLKELSLQLGRKDVKPSDISEVMDKIATEHPKEDELVRVFQQEMERSYQHFDKWRILNLPQQRLAIYDMPSFLRPRVPFVYYSPAPALDIVRVANLFIASPDPKLSAKDRELVMRTDFTYPYIEMAVVHEIMPGRHLRQSSMENASRFRKLFNSPMLSNGWAMYSLFLAQENGFFTSPYSKLIYLRWKMIKAARGLVDVKLHRKNMDYADAVSFLTSDTGMSDAQAKAEVYLISVSPTEGITYMIGMEKILEMRKFYKKLMDRKFNVRDFHSRLLSLGNMPFYMVEEEMKRLYREQEKVYGL